MIIRQVNLVESMDWDALVTKTYGKTYFFQQQDGCKDRGLVVIQVPDESPYDREEGVSSCEGVSFNTWLNTDPKQSIDEDYTERLIWERNFFPDVSMVANDLYEKGLIPKGPLYINIDW